MLSRTPLLVVLLLACLTLCGPSIAFAQSGADSAEQTAAKAADLFAEGMAQFNDNKLEQAKETLIRVDGMQLPKEQRVTLWETIQEIDRRIQPSVVPMDILEDANDARDAGDFARASELYRKVINDPTAAANDRDRAQAELAAIERSSNPQLTKMKHLLDEIDAAIGRGDLPTAQAQAMTVQDSGVKLGWFDESRLKRQLAIIEEKNAANGIVAPEPVVTQDNGPDADAGDEGVEKEPLPEGGVVINPDADTGSDEGGDDGVEKEPLPEGGVVINPDADTGGDEGGVEIDPDAADAGTDDDAAADTGSDLIARTQQLHTQRLIQEAQQAEVDNHWRLAVEKYQRALQNDPGNRQLVRALEQAQRQADSVAAPRPLLGQQQVSKEIRRKAILDRYEQLMEKSRQALATGDYTRAESFVDQAKLTVQNGERFLPQVTYNEKIEESTVLAARISETELNAQAEAQRIQDEKDAADALVEKEEAERARYEDVQRLLQRIRTLQAEQQYRDALVLLNQVLFIDPNNIAAQLLRDMIEDQVLYEDYEKIQRQVDHEFGILRNENKKATTPFNTIMNYPDDWPEITARRLGVLESEGAESEVNRQTRAQLRNPVPVAFDGTPLNLAMEFLRQNTGLNFFVNWPALEAAGVAPDTPITLQLSNVPADQALRLVLQAASVSAFEPVSFSIIDGIVTISTQTDLTKATDIQIYDIRDMLVQVPNFTNAPEFDLQNALDSGTRGNGQGGGGGNRGGGNRGGGGGGGGGGLFGDNDDDEEEEEQLSRTERVDQILELIRSTVGKPEDWEFFGGEVSSVRELNGNLIVRSTPDNHREVVELLGQLREALAVQINIECRFLLVDQNFLHDVGIDLDITISDSVLGGNFGDVTIGSGTADLAGRQTTVLTPGVFGPAPAGDPNAGAFTRAFSLGIDYLGDIQANLVISATQGARRAITLTAPRITLMNGQRAFLLVARQISFISDLTPVPDTLGFDVDVGIVESGIVLDVQATVSADRRYVTLTMRPSLTTIQQPIRQLPIVAAFAGPNDPNDPNNPDNPDDVIVASAFIELPELEITQVRTTVSVPDRGTLLIGGQRLVSEIEIEAGVPILSKIPFLNRFFTNNNTVKDQRTLLILVKPTIIIQSEEEELLFPGLLDDPANFGTGLRDFNP